MGLTSKAKENLKTIGIVGGIIAVLSVIAIVVFYNWGEIKSWVGMSSKKSTSRDRGNVIVAKGKAPASKKKPKLAKKKAKKPKKGKKSTKPTTTPAADKDTAAKPSADKPAAEPATEPAEETNRCAELPFSYEFKDDDPDAKHPFRKKFWGSNFGCLLAGVHDEDKPGPLPQVREELNAMSSAQFERYKAHLEKIMRKYACRTFDYYVTTCKQYLDPSHEHYLSVDELSVLFRQQASLYDVSGVDRHRFSYHAPRPKKKTKKVDVFEPPTETSSSSSTATKPKKRRIKVGINTQPLPPRLCGDLRRCPKP